MSEMNPAEAAQLAMRIYDVQNADLVDLFLKLPQFSQIRSSSFPNKHLIAEVGGRVILNHTDGFGVCAHGSNSNDLYLIFRGTTMANNGADVFTDARIGITNISAGLPVHVGFNHTFTSMLADIRKFFESINDSKTVHCVGHSLGAAIASLAADWVARNTIHSVKLYTFGSPRVGTENFAKSTTNKIGVQNIHRVYHRTDPVTMVPLYPFMHAPYDQVGHYLFSAEPLSTGEAHKMGKYKNSVAERSWSQLVDTPENPYTIEAAIEAWLQSKLPVDRNSAAFWHWVDSALIYVIKKITMGAILALQGAFITTFTIADKIAYILAKGINLAENISVWIEHLMRKLMQVLGMQLAKTKEELTQTLIRTVLLQITEKANKEARDAIKKL